MSITGNEHIGYDNTGRDNSKFFSDGLESKFNEKKFEEFQKQMDKIRKDVDSRFLTSFEKYEKEVSKILSENKSVIASQVVQEELSKQNTRISIAFEKDSLELSSQYNKLFGGNSINNTDYNGSDTDDLAA